MILEVRHAKKRFGGIKALNNATISAEKGAITAIIGPNGSGKSTLFHIISNIEKKDSGDIFFNDKIISNLKDYKISQQGISRTFQEVRLFKHLTIRDHFHIALSDSDQSLVKSFFFTEKNKDEDMQKMLDEVHLLKDLGTIVTDLSYGQRKLLDLAVALAKPHTLLMLDEPVAGVNPKLRKEIKTILKKLRKKGESILLIEHDMDFVMDLADHIIVMDEGKVIAEGKPKDIQNNKKVLDAYLGE